MEGCPIWHTECLWYIDDSKGFGSMYGRGLKINVKILKKNSEYDQEILQSQTADKPMAPRGRAT